MVMKVKVEGLEGIEQALKELPRATGKNVLRRVLRKRGQPIADKARSLVPVDEGDLKASIAVSTKLTKLQRRKHKKFDKDDVEVFVGAGSHPQAHLQEFGSSIHGPQAFMRPAWDAGKKAVLKGIGVDLWAEINKAAKRLARKAAKAAAKG